MSMIPYKKQRRANALNDLVAGLAGMYLDPSGVKSGIKQLAGGAMGAKLATDIAKKVSGNIKSYNGKSLRGRQTSVPAAMSNKITSSAPQQIVKSGVVTISNRELLNGSVTSANAFTLGSTYVLNPGMSSTFPWLSSQASQYEQYKFRKLVFTYIPSVGTSQSGDIMMAVDYNVQDPIPLTENSLLDRSGAIIGAVWESLSLSLKPGELHSSGGRKYVRSVAVAGDPKTFDAGLLHVATNNVTTVSTVGKLFVEYTIDLYSPQIATTYALAPTLTSNAFMNLQQTIVKNVVTPIVFGYVAPAFDPLRFFSVATGGVYTPPAGCYEVRITASAVNSVSESTQYNLYVLRDGVQFPSASTLYQSQAQLSGGANCTQSLNWGLVVPLNGSQTFSAVVVLVGNTGVLTLLSAAIVVKLA